MKRLAFILSLVWLALVLMPGAPLAAARMQAQHTRTVAACTHDCCAENCACCEGGTCTCEGAACKCCTNGTCDMKKCEKKCDKGCTKTHEEKK